MSKSESESGSEVEVLTGESNCSTIMNYRKINVCDHQLKVLMSRRIIGTSERITGKNTRVEY